MLELRLVHGCLLKKVLEAIKDLVVHGCLLKKVLEAIKDLHHTRVTHAPQRIDASSSYASSVCNFEGQYFSLRRTTSKDSSHHCNSGDLGACNSDQKLFQALKSFRFRTNRLTVASVACENLENPLLVGITHAISDQNQKNLCTEIAVATSTSRLVAAGVGSNPPIH
ncbi:hypothetical protein U1Q18_033814 [Sarracenia purpurea var. burkii]